jgi:hypothetical protein
MMEDTAQMQAALDANPRIGGNAVVEKVTFDAIIDDSGGGSDGDNDNNAAIIGGVIGGSALALAVIALLITRRWTNASYTLKGTSKTAHVDATFFDIRGDNMEQAIGEQEQKTDVDNDDRVEATAEYQRFFAKNFAKNREDFVNSLKPNDSPMDVKRAFDKNLEAFEAACKAETMGRGLFKSQFNEESNLAKNLEASEIPCKSETIAHGLF